MNTSENLNVETTRRMLREIGAMAEESAMTGNLRGASAQLAAHYNSLLDRVTKAGAVDAALFSPMDPHTATMESLTVSSRMLAASLEDRHCRCGSEGCCEADGEDNNIGALCGIAPFVDPDTLGTMLLHKLEQGAALNTGVLAALAPFLPQEAIAEAVRRFRAPAPPAPPTPPAAPPAVSTLATPLTPGERLQYLAGRLIQPGLSDEERQQVNAQIADLAQKSRLEG
jgi:hypothetical protein